MKKYLIIATLIISLLPVGLKAQTWTDAELQDICDNEIWYEELEVYKIVTTIDPNELSWLEKEFAEDYMKYLIGEDNNRTKYNNKALNYCVNREHRWCEWGVFPLYYYNERMVMNYPSAALAVNNKELFEALIREYPFLLDNAIVDYENYHSNGYFYTPALLMIRNSQFGVLKYLIEKYDVNLLRNSGYIYRDRTKPQRQINALELAQQAVDRWVENGNETGIACARKTLEVVQDWYNRNQNNRKYNNQSLKDYNKELNRIANMDEQKAENQVPADYEGKPILFMDIEEKYAEMKEIEKQINNVEIQIMMDKLMRDLDFSFLTGRA